MRVTDDIKYVGVNDHQVDLFEGQYVVPRGMAYNSYVILDEKIAVMDTVDQHFGEEWLANLAAVLGDRKPDYLIVQHMEPDHSANITSFLGAYPDAVVIGNAKTFTFMEQFYGKNPSMKKQIVKNGASPLTASENSAPTMWKILKDGLAKRADTILASWVNTDFRHRSSLRQPRDLTFRSSAPSTVLF